jgi:hypothetical protein
MAENCKQNVHGVQGSKVKGQTISCLLLLLASFWRHIKIYYVYITYKQGSIYWWFGFDFCWKCLTPTECHLKGRGESQPADALLFVTNRTLHTNTVEFYFVYFGELKLYVCMFIYDVWSDWCIVFTEWIVSLLNVSLVIPSILHPPSPFTCPHPAFHLTDGCDILAVSVHVSVSSVIRLISLSSAVLWIKGDSTRRHLHVLVRLLQEITKFVFTPESKCPWNCNRFVEQCWL